ncbi:MAG: ABC transporter permease, partial [Chloroflexota bacterium]|nr:ABC transporter permease [Chloroflexota bacterium]
MSGAMVDQPAAQVPAAGRRSRFQIEPVVDPSIARRVGVPLLSVLLALVAGGAIMLLAGENPVTVYRAMFTGAFGSRYAFSETLVKTIPLLLTGLGVGVAFRMQLWNIGAEGQLYLGAIGATWVALYALPEAQAGVVIPAMMVAGLAGGALWAAGPAALRARLGVNEIITTLMLNYVA